jgi:hypothetical protein
VEKKKRIKTPQGELDVTEVGFQSGTEHWNEYLLDDNTVLRAKYVVTSIVRMDGRYDAQGQPMYMLQTSPVVAVSAPDDLRKQS